MIQMTKLGDSWYWNYDLIIEDRIARFSPDGKKFVILLRKGNLENNANEFSLLLWRTGDGFSFPTPDVLVTMSSFSNEDAIQDIRWQPDSETIAFLGMEPGQQRQLYTLNVRTRRLRMLTHHPTGIASSNDGSYSLSADGNKVVFLASRTDSDLWNEKAERQGLVVEGQPLVNLLTGHGGGRQNVPLYQSSGSSESSLTLSGETVARWPLPQISPNGKYVLVAIETKSAPTTWREYTDTPVREAVTKGAWLGRYALKEIATGKNRGVLLGGPVLNPKVLWAPDSQSIVFESAYLPLEGTNDEERKTRAASPFAVEVNIRTGEITKVDNRGLRLLAWERQTNRLVFQGADASGKAGQDAKVYFAKQGDKWEEVPETVLEKTRPKIVIEEDKNTPPKIFAVDAQTNRRTLLWDLNPQFEKLKFGKVEEFHGKTGDGSSIKWGLYYPVDYVPGRKYPLVIQTHGWRADRFWIDGQWTTAFAAQALAGKGFMVLQSEGWDDHDSWKPIFDTPNEVVRHVAAYEAEIADLNERGLIDLNRVGIVGFSRTCYFVKYALIHSKYHFAAASIANGMDAGYFQYLAFIDEADSALEFEKLNGGLPWGSGLKYWVQRAPGFSLDSVHTPLQITAMNPGSILEEWEWYAGLHQLSKPVEMTVIRDGAHALQKPWDRMVSQQGTVDWFCFWLEDEEDSDPAKAGQYARWRELRKQQQVTNSSILPVGNVTEQK